MEIHAFLSLVDHYQQSIKVFAWIAKPLNEHLAGEGASRKTEWVSLSEDTLRSLPGFETGLNECPHPCLCQTTLRIFYSKQTLLRKYWEWYFPKNKQMGNTTWSPMAAGPSLPMKRNYHSTKLEFLALKYGPFWNISRNTCYTGPS